MNVYDFAPDLDLSKEVVGVRTGCHRGEVGGALG